MTMTRRIGLGLGALGLAALANACASPEARNETDSVGPMAVADTVVDLTGAGATFPYPLYARWFNEYARRTSVRINYHSVGSGNGIAQLLERTVDFGATDAPMSGAESAQSSAPIIHIPTVLGAVAITYNLPELTRPLRLSGDVLADVFLGRITRWDDPRLAALNPEATLPARALLVAHRDDASGTSYIFSDYLSTVSSGWRSGPGRGRRLVWPSGVGGTGNEGVAGYVKQAVGSIGYVEVVYARQNRLPVAHVRNRSGRFISPMPFEIASAAASSMQDDSSSGDLRRSLVDARGDQSYPISSFTWILLSPEHLGPGKTRQLVDFLQWALTDGGDIASSLGYVALPTVTAARALGLLDSLAAASGRRP